MSILFIITGILILLVVIYDITYTTLAPKGAGVISKKISKYVWRICLKTSDYDGNEQFLTNIGYLLLYIILITWILLIWLGNTLIIFSDPEAITYKDKFVTSFIDKAYYTGYLLSTMGSGEYHPVKPFWKIYAALVSFSGFGFFTMAISYLIPVVNAVAEKRALANYIASLGKNSIEILKNGYDGENFTQLEAHFHYLTPEILKLTKNHQAYPALHYFHENKIADSICIYMSCLDEVISILLCDVNKEQKPGASTILPLRHALTLFLQTLHGAYLNPQDKEPDIPDYEKLKHVIPGDITSDHFKNSFGGLNKRRRIILSYLEHHGWTWEDVYTADFSLEFE